MANAWNESQWGIGDWGLQNDANQSLTGIDSSISVDSILYVGEPGGWGQLTWGFGEWGDQINPNVDVTGLQLNTSIGNEEAFTDININLSTNLITSTTNTLTITGGTLVEPTFVLTNTTTGTVFAGENVIIQVTTPGTETTWGINSWGSGAWNQISGTELQIGDESITGTGTLNLTGNQLNTTTGTFTIIGDANLILSTNIISVTTNSVVTKLDVDINVTAPGDLAWGATAWGNGSWGNIGGMFISQGAEEEVVPSVEVNITGNALIFTLTSIAQITADANLTLNTNILTVSLGDEDVIPNTLITLSTNLLNISMGTASGEALSSIAVTGVQVSSETGRLFITAWAVVDIGVTNAWSVVDIAA